MREDIDGLESAGGRAGTEGGSEEDKFVIVDDEAAGIVAAGAAAAAVPRSQGLGGEAISRAHRCRQ